MTPAVMRALVDAVCALPEGGKARLAWWEAAEGWGRERELVVWLLPATGYDVLGTWRARVDGLDELAADAHATRADAEAWLRAEVARLWPEGSDG